MMVAKRELLEDKTVKELKQMARDKDLPGRSSLSKSGLIDIVSGEYKKDEIKAWPEEPAGKVEPEEIHIVWLQGQSCSGCTVSLTNAADPSLVDVLTGFLPEFSGISVDVHQTIMGPWGDKVTDTLKEVEEGKLDPFVLVLEGALPDEESAKERGGFWCGFGEEDGEVVTTNDWFSRLSEKAAAVVSAGTCASYGGVPSGEPNPTGAKGALDFLGKFWESRLGLPLVCVPGCPVQGDNLLKTLGYGVLVVRGLLEKPTFKDLSGLFEMVDGWHRPKFAYGKLVHESCPRAGHFGGGDYSEEFGEPYCMGLLGCKGLISHCNVSERGFVDGEGGCTAVGSPCIGCTEPEFPDEPYSPFLAKAPASEYASDVFEGMGGHIRAMLKRLFARNI